MTRFPWLNRSIEEAKGLWKRFQALPWRWQAAALAGTGLLVAVVATIATVVAVSSGNGAPGLVMEPSVTASVPTPTVRPTQIPTPTPSPKPTPSLTPTPTPTPAPIPTTAPPPPPTPSPPAMAPPPVPSPPPPPPPDPMPEAGAYSLVPTLPGANFSRMVGFATVPGTSDQAAVITQHLGQIWKVFLGGAASQLMGDISGKLIGSPANEEGLLGLAFSPGFQSDRRLYLYYTADEGCPEGFSRCSKLSRFQVPGETIDVGSEKVLLKVGQPFSNHNGGQIVFGPDGLLYVALGDGGASGDPQGNGQNLSTLLGSILRLDVSGQAYTVPPGNPFGSEIYAYGLRNPWRFSFDRKSGQMWAGDVGQNQWEEVDRIVAGGNYGWNTLEGFECFSPPSGCSKSGLRPPRAVYGHDEGCSVTGGYVYRGGSMPELDGWYVYGDFCTGRVWAVDTADPPVADEPVMLANTGLAIASFGELPDGELLALTFDNAVFRLQRAQ